MTCHGCGGSRSTPPDNPSPGEGTWVPIPVRGWPDGVPFTDRTLAHVKRLVAERGYAHADRQGVVRELRDLLERMSTDDLTPQEKTLAAGEVFARRGSTAAAAAPTQETSVWDDPEEVLDEVVLPPAGTVRSRVGAQKVPVFDGDVEPFDFDDEDEFDPLTGPCSTETS